jgi:hypothetical protein
MVAVRESSLQQGLVHRLSPDLEGSIAAWRKMQATYEGNPHAKDQSKWQTYGLFGMNSNYFTLVWDKAASPEVLCDAIVDVLVYRRAAARMLRKAGGTIVCKDDNGQPYNFTTKATWETVHRAVSGGKLCPSKHEETAATMRKFFRHRATRIGLDPDQPVTLKMLGLEPDKSLAGETWADQETMVMGLWSEFETAETLAQAKLAEATEKAAEKVAALPRRPQANAVNLRLMAIHTRSGVTQLQRPGLRSQSPAAVASGWPTGYARRMLAARRAGTGYPDPVYAPPA